jgi:uncharacterized coiled-coil protein SlyX
LSRTKTKQWSNITDLTEQWIKDSYPNSLYQDIWKFHDRLNSFFEWLNQTDKQFVENYKRSKDKAEWSKAIGLKVIAYYNHRLNEGYSTNTVRAEISTVRAFCRDNCTTLILPRRKIAKAKASTNEHEFTREDLSKMFNVGDPREKAIVATAISLGFAVEDFSELQRDLIENLVNKAIAEKIDFIGFNYERKKTGVHSRSHLTPESVQSLKAWFEYIDKKRAEEHKPKSQWVWSNGNGSHIDSDTFNRIVKDLVKKANIITTGKVRFHCLGRKFLMSALVDSGKFSEFETKRVIAKEIPSSDSTYLTHLDRTIDAKFGEVYPLIRLNGSSTNHTRIEELEQKIITLEQKNEDQAIEIETLKRVIEYSIPKAKVQDAIRKLAQENDLNVSEFVGRDFFKTPISLNELITAIAKRKKQQTEGQE